MTTDPLPRKGKRPIEWGSPRYYQEKRTHTHPAKRKGGYCKALKGPHEYGDEQPATHKWTDEVWYWEKRCVGCGKRKITRFTDLF